MIRSLVRLFRDNKGATVVEFALLLPVIFGTLLGVLQVGLGMQAYNSLRNVSADASRYAVVEYQKENKITGTAIEDQAKAIATAAPYLLETARFDAKVKLADTQRVSGAIEYELKTTYTTRSVLGFMGLNDVPISFTRPIFVLDS